jgi:putative polyhydroxyalkanoate system protein
MADIKLVRSHSLPIAKAKQIVQTVADDLGEEYNLTSDWRGDTLHFRRQGVDGTMRVTDSQIGLDVTLGFLLKPFKSKLLDHIERTFDRLLAKNEKPAARVGKKTSRRE